MADAIYVPKSDILDLITEENEAGGFTDYSNYSNLWDEVDDMPAADVQPVKHGQWKGYITSAFYGCDDEGEPIYRDANFNVCSECGRKTVVKEKFCPNCGARMDGDRDD